MSNKLLKLFESDIDRFKQVLTQSETLAQICNQYGFSNHGRNTGKATLVINKFNLDSSHLRTSGSFHAAPPKVKICPQCGIEFISKPGGKDSVCCSHACANKYFSWKQGTKNKITGIGSYRNTLQQEYERKGFKFKCCVCEESNPIMVDIHHIDENRYNNTLENLVPLCVLHHRTWHSTQDSLIFDKIVEELDRR